MSIIARCCGGLKRATWARTASSPTSRSPKQLQTVLLPKCDLIVGTAMKRSTSSAARPIRSPHSAPFAPRASALIVLKLGPQGCAAFAGAIPEAVEEGARRSGLPGRGVQCLGAGDAFMAGFLRGWLRGESVERCCTLGNASGAIVVSRHGCAPAMPTWEEMQHFLAMPSAPIRLREADASRTPALGHNAAAAPMMNSPCSPSITARSLKTSPRRFGADDSRIAQFKRWRCAP
jgi:5-dehydro-2-deoxygluconokinase